MKLTDIHGIPGILVTALRLFGCDRLLSEAVPSWPEEWAQQIIANPRFQDWLSSLGIVGELGPPMTGSVGRAYPIGDYIIKFTTDSKEADAATVMKGHESEHAAGIYDVKRVGKFQGTWGEKILWVIIMDRLNVGVGGKYRMASNAVYSYLDDNPGFLEDTEAVVRVTMSRYIKPKYQNEKMRKLVQQVVDAIYDVQQKTGVLLQDPHGGNIAFKGRKPAFFDVGRSSIDWENPVTAGARVGTL